MKPSPRILISSLGSIGTRHLTNLLSIVGSNSIVLHRSSTAVLPEFPDIPVFESLEEALVKNTFTHALVCGPTSLHVKTASLLVRHGVPNIFVEKPLSHSWDEAISFQRSIANSPIKITLGFDLRFDRGLLKVKEMLNDQVIGKVVMVQASVGQYLPDWRPNQDYSKGTSASKELGGGVIFDLIHEIDYVSWLTGPVEWLSCLSGKLSDLLIETEDVACISWMSQQGVLVSISLDYLQRRLSRSCKFIGTRGSIIWNYVDNKVECITGGSPNIVEYCYEQERNERFFEEMNNFLLPNPSMQTADLYDGLYSLKLALAAKASSSWRQMIKINNFNPSQS